MTKHLLVSGLLAGLAAALLATLLQFAFLERHILLAERYETGALQHFAGAGPEAADHAHTAAEADHADTPETPFWQRQLKTLLTMIVTYGGYGLVLAAGFAFASHFGRPVSPAQSLLWGLAGFAAFSLSPAMGLEPALPGVEGADLAARQFWWMLCAGATVAGLGVLAYGTNLVPRLAGVVLLAIPHIIGAPHPAEFTGILPPELASQYAARSLGVGLIVWVTLGGLVQRFWTRMA